MTVSTATVATANASRYLQQLCKHWSHRFPTEFTPEHGTIDLDGTRCILDASPEALVLRVETAPEKAADMEAVVARHIERFAFREELTFRWKREG